MGEKTKHVLDDDPHGRSNNLLEVVQAGAVVGVVCSSSSTGDDAPATLLLVALMQTLEASYAPYAHAGGLPISTSLHHLVLASRSTW